MLYSVSFAEYAGEYAAPTVNPISTSLFTFIPLLYLLVAIGFGLITRYINKSKGYEGGFAWGFWLAFIGIIVVACKPDNRSSSQPQNNIPITKKSTADEIKEYKELYDQGIITEEEFQMKKQQLLKKM